ncbi:MAG: N4-gp56 family major capsid protein [Candidatus Marinimicrobia bacterium]|jgi:N4-gp56 family major capsid protein|nr:N4-gp56 family major capsid protein [Candidatus Neomarinimicrobiota bacterium]
MAFTNFAALTSEQKKVWSRDLWKYARNNSFINKFAGSGSNAMVQRISELTKTERGDQAVITLLTDLEGDGTVGDNTLEGNEEQIKAYDKVIRIDQIRHANRTTGRMADQKTIVNFRENSRDALAYWLSDRMDQMAFLTMSGVGFNYTTSGVARSGSSLASLEFASDVSAPTANRHFQWDATNGLSTGDVTAVGAADTPSYAMLVEMKAKAKDKFIRGIRAGGGEEVFHVFMSPQGMAKLKLDSDYLANVRNAGVRGSKNELFAGSTSVLVDGMWIHEYSHVLTPAASADTGEGAWGVKGQRVLMCGAQALAMADLGKPSWDEKDFDYNNQKGISTSKIMGMLKPKFHSIIDSGVEDFGLIAVDTAI